MTLRREDAVLELEIYSFDCRKSCDPRSTMNFEQFMSSAFPHYLINHVCGDVEDPRRQVDVSMPL